MRDQRIDSIATTATYYVAGCFYLRVPSALTAVELANSGALLVVLADVTEAIHNLLKFDGAQCIIQPGGPSPSLLVVFEPLPGVASWQGLLFLYRRRDRARLVAEL